MVLPDSHEIPRVPCYLGKRKTSDRHTPTGVSPSTLRFSNRFNFIHQFMTRRSVNSQTTTHPTTPAPQRLSAITRHRFSLFHFRSPLLTESLLFSLPTGTEMFHFPAFPLIGLYIQPAVTHHNNEQGFPIRTSADQSLFASSPRLFAGYNVLHRL